MNKLITFFQEIKVELEKVTWPNRDELVGAVVIVSILAIFFAVIIGVMDSVITMFIKWVIR